MLEIHSLHELNAFFQFPFITQWKQSAFNTVTFSFTNLTKDTVNGITISLDRMPTGAYENFTFQSLQQYLESNEIARLTDLLKTIVNESQTYVHSAHKVDITFTGNEKNKLTLTRYFIIPSSFQTDQFEANVAFNINKNIVTYGFQLQDKENILLDTETLFIIRTKWSDVVIHNNHYEPQFLSAKINANVAGFDMSKLICFVFTRKMNKQFKEFSGFNFYNQTTILTPQISSQTSGVSVNTEKKKVFTSQITITSPTFNGIEYIDNGYLFYKDGIKLRVIGDDAATLKVNRRIGLEV